MSNTRDRALAPSTCKLVVIAAAVCLAGGTALADLILAKAERSWGTVKIERGGVDQDFVPGMGLLDGDIIKTERKSGAVIEWLDRDGEVFAKEEFFGLPGPNGCADAEGERGKAEAEIKGKNKPDNKRETITKLKKGTSLLKTLPGKEEKAKDHFAIDQKSVLKKKGTDYALTYDLGSDQTSLSTLGGAVDIDNVQWTSLADAYFTNPLDKSFDTLNLDVILNLESGVVDILDVLGAGNTVEVGADFYSIVLSPPSDPEAGKAPIHKELGGLSPEPGTLCLLAVGVLALLRRRR